MWTLFSVFFFSSEKQIIRKWFRAQNWAENRSKIEMFKSLENFKWKDNANWTSSKIDFVQFHRIGKSFYLENFLILKFINTNWYIISLLFLLRFNKIHSISVHSVENLFYGHLKPIKQELTRSHNNTKVDFVRLFYLLFVLCVHKFVSFDVLDQSIRESIDLRAAKLNALKKSMLNEIQKLFSRQKKIITTTTTLKMCVHLS